MSDTTIKLSIKRKQVDLELEHEDGTVHKYTIREMTGAARDQYISSVSKRAKLDGEGKVVSMGDVTGLQASLISMCLYDNDGKLVPPAIIQAMSATSQNALFETCSNLNGMDKGAEGSSKNG